MYIENEALPQVMAKIISDYNLVDKNELNKKNVTRFIDQYEGGPALLAKIKSFEDYLDETRHFNEQEKRDRTKPVTIINDRVIIQDGVKIGLIVEYKNFSESKVPFSVTYDTTNPRKPPVVEYSYATNSTTETNILLTNGRKVENLRYNYTWSSQNPSKKSGNTKRNLYQISKDVNKKIGSITDEYLMYICALIEDYAL